MEHTAMQPSLSELMKVGLLLGEGLFFFSSLPLAHNSTLPVRCLHFCSVCEMLIVSSL